MPDARKKLNGIKYCLHPGRVSCLAFVKDDDGKPTDKKVSAWKYINAKDLIRLYGIEESECVTWTRDLATVDGLIHLSPDPKGIYELPKIEVIQRTTRPEENGKRRAKSVSNLGSAKSKKRS